MGKKADKRKLGTPLKVLLKNTPRKILDARSEVKIQKRGYAITSQGFAEGRFDVKSDEPTTSRKPPKHKVIVVLTDLEKEYYWVSCSCEFFTFNLEYALVQHNSSAIIYSNGMPASTTNPNNRPYLCRHLVKVLTNKTLTNKLKRSVR